MIYLDKVYKKYNENEVLKNINFSIDPGEFVSLVGPSGAGKTTILKMIIAEEKPTAGNVFFQSIDIHKIPKRRIHHFRRKVGIIFQDNRLISNKTAYENIAFVMEAAGRAEDEIENEVPEVLKVVGLEDKLWNFPHELSGGERQRVAIARAVINQPELVLADEPTGNLDPINTIEIMDILKKINELGTTVFMTTHNKGVIDSLNKRVITLNKGEIIRDDKEGRYSIA